MLCYSLSLCRADCGWGAGAGGFAITLLGALDFVNLLGGEANLRDDVAVGLREAVEQVVVVAERYHIAYLVEVEIGVDRVGAKWLLLVVELAVAAVKKEALLIVAESALADSVELVVGDSHQYLDGQIYRVFTALDLALDALTLPVIPGGNAVKFGLTLG